MGDQFRNRVGTAEGQPAEIAGTSITCDECFVFAVNKEDAKLLSILNEGLRKIMVSPFWLELIKKYKSGVSSSE